MNNSLRSVCLLLVSSLTFSCSFPSFQPIPVNNNLANSAKKLQLALSDFAKVSVSLKVKDQNGVINPIVPSDIKSLTLNGKEIPKQNIQIPKSVTDQIKEKIQFNGSGVFSFSSIDPKVVNQIAQTAGIEQSKIEEVIKTGNVDSDTVQKVISSGAIDENTIKQVISAVSLPLSENKDLLQLQLNGSEQLISIPLLNQLQNAGFSIKSNHNNRFISVVITKDNNGGFSSVNGVYDNDNNGSADDNETVFTVDLKKETFTLIKPDGTAEKIPVTELINKEKEELKPETEKLTEEKVEELKKEIVAEKRPIEPYIGSWAYNAGNEKVKLSLRLSGESEFIGSVVFNGQTYSASGNFDNKAKDLPELNISIKYRDNQDVKIKIKVKSDNELSVMLKNVPEELKLLKIVEGIALPIVREN